MGALHLFRWSTGKRVMLNCSPMSQTFFATNTTHQSPRVLGIGKYLTRWTSGQRNHRQHSSFSGANKSVLSTAQDKTSALLLFYPLCCIPNPTGPWIPLSFQTSGVRGPLTKFHCCHLVKQHYLVPRGSTARCLFLCLLLPSSGPLTSAREE